MRSSEESAVCQELEELLYPCPCTLASPLRASSGSTLAALNVGIGNPGCFRGTVSVSSATAATDSNRL